METRKIKLRIKKWANEIIKKYKMRNWNDEKMGRLENEKLRKWENKLIRKMSKRSWENRKSRKSEYEMIKKWKIE